MKLNGKIILRGVGLHSGNECELMIEPCSASEIIMCSDENENGLPLKNFALNGTNRGSDYIFQDGTVIKTCEHVFSALAGMGIYSGVKITVKGGEMPALDGCAKKLCDEILVHSDGIFEPDKIEPLIISEPLEITSENNNDRKIAVLPNQSGGFRITYTVEYDFIGVQTFDYEHSPENYYKNIACARTFAMASDIEYLRSHGMALGGSLDNAIVIGEKIQASGGLRWKDEFVRHKILDLIGDMAAVGRPLNAHITAVKAGHELHLKLAEKIRKLIKK